MAVYFIERARYKARFLYFMMQKECYQHLVTGGATTYVDAVQRMNHEYDLRLPSRTIRTARIQEISMRYSHDLAHTDGHLLELTQNAELMVHQKPSLLREVNWSQLFDFISLHDAARAAIPMTPITLFSSQILEHVFAPITARRYMQQHWMGDVDHELLGIIARHPFHAGHVSRVGRVYSPTEQLSVDVDGLSVLTPGRVDSIYAHIQKSFFGISLKPFHGLLSGIFNTYTQFDFFYPEAEKIAKIWRPEAEKHIQEKFLRRQ